MSEAHEKLVVVGQGYVGLPLAIRAVEAGYDVVGLEVDEPRVTSLRGGRSTVEDISDERLSDAIRTGRYLATTDTTSAAGFDVAVISVPTPLRDGVPDLGFVEQASSTLAAHLRPGATVVLESTTYPGTTDELVAPILESSSGLKAGQDFHLGYSPERIDPGNQEWTLENTPKVVSGIDPGSLEAVQRFYDRIVVKTVPVSGTREAELTKLLENTFRHVNIALVNELAVFAHQLDINVWEAIDAASTKPFGYMKFTPGPGVGGHCLPIDPSYLSWRVEQSLGRSFRFVELANEVNEHMPDYVVERVVTLLNDRSLPVRGRSIVVLGYAYKKNTSDARETPARRVCELLLDRGAVVTVVDPHVDERYLPAGIERSDFSKRLLRDSDLTLLLVDHDEFMTEWVAHTARCLLDTRNRLVGPSVTRL